jgi:predicted nucleotidyltransferase
MLSDLDIDVNEETSTRYYQLVCLKCGARHAKHDCGKRALKTFYLLMSKIKIDESDIKKAVTQYEELEQENIKLKKRQKRLNETIDDFQLQLAGANHTVEILQDIITKALER